eukprot:CAMPEP_0197545766 /NCGR_PEP_ID=MMETSP1320-20131121/673_1 /TAXON_ID=91990 /ORGANISM="Bolidomonas sp., Strain RCC2347" /LENGTH=985 /DNA_ID=CAMNT_0043105301 /DNA_START=176 /DNA_END=3133 /DNA_ORIENTATION=-
MFSSRKEKKLAKATVSGITKSGYLTKHATSGLNWKKRYFVLNGNTLTYFPDHRHTDTPKGDVLLTEDATLENFSTPEFPFGFCISTQFVKLKMAARDDDERTSWTNSLRLVIADLVNSMRGYLYKSGRFLEAKQVRKFFMLHSDCITYHQDLHKTSTIQGMRMFSGRTTVEPDGEKSFIVRTNLKDGKFWKLKADTPHERDRWVANIKDTVSKLGMLEVDFQNTAVDDLTSESLHNGFLSTRPKNGTVEWEERYFVLTDSKLYQFEDDSSISPQQVFILSPNCSVFETKLQEHSFEFVTNSRVLHVQGDNPEVTTGWIKKLREASKNSKALEEDPLLLAAKKQKAIFYDVIFETKKPLGLVLERSGDWALVKLANQETTHVSIGSALTKVNGEDVVLADYQSTIQRLTAWQPPLSLGFRLAPEKRGWLTKQGRGRKSKRKNWKPRYFVLAEGRLSYFSSDGPDAVLKGVIHLMGSAVSLVHRSETSQYFCFKVVSGITGIIMQGMTVDEMMDWASAIYHAISVANGGGYLLDAERERLALLEAEKSKEDEGAQATKDLEEKKRLELIAAKEAKDAAEREEIARIEAEKAEKAGQEEAAKKARLLEEEERKKALEAKAREEEALKVTKAAEVVVEDINTELAVMELEKEKKEEEANGGGGEDKGADGFDAYNAAEGDGGGEEEPTIWQAYWNTDHNVWYYYNIETEETRWDRPEGVDITINQPEVWAEEEVQESNVETVVQGDGGGEVQQQQQDEEGQEEEEEQEEEQEETPPPVVQEQEEDRNEEGEEEQEEKEEKEEEEQEQEQEQEEDEDEDEDDDDDSGAEEPPPPSSIRNERRRSTVPIVPPPVPTSEPPPEDEEDEEETVFAQKKVAQKDIKARTVIEGDAVVPLTDDELKEVFATCDRGVVKGQLNPMLFGTLLRTITGCKNLYDEMNMFSFFNTSGDGVVDLAEFLDGCKRLAAEPDGLKTQFYRGLVQYHKKDAIVL